MEIVVFGAGSLGSVIGGLLARKHPVTLVGRAPHINAIRETGLTITGEIEAHVTPDAETTVPGSADLVIVTVKAYDTTAAAEQLADCDCDAVLSLQNGIGNEATLAAALDAHVLAGTATYGAMFDEPGAVTCTGVGEIVLGDPDGGHSQIADHVGDAFRTAGIETTVDDDMPRRRWEKLAVNAAVNATTALARVENGELVEGAGGAVAADAARETARVAREQGVALSDERALSLTRQVVRDTAANRSSMLQDVAAGRRTEIDAINGYVVRVADGPVPVNETLVRLVRTWSTRNSTR